MYTIEKWYVSSFCVSDTSETQAEECNNRNDMRSGYWNVTFQKIAGSWFHVFLQKIRANFTK